MALNSSGPISLAGTTAGQSIEIELGGNGTTQISLNDASVRTLAGVASGAITMPTNFYGKSNRVALSYTFSANTANASLNVTSISGYVAGTSDITITINTGVYLYSTSTSNAGLTLTGGTTGDTITLVNNGYIMGQGGDGGNGKTQDTVGINGNNGCNAISLGFNTTINNTNASAYIGGGGGGGGGNRYVNNPLPCSGGGGAGGGAGGGSYFNGGTYWSPTPGGTIGNIGNTQSGNQGGGASGGRIFPGTGGAGAVITTSETTGGALAKIGGAGGAGGGGGAGCIKNGYCNGGNGGAGSAAGTDGAIPTSASVGGGGGGWGASGGMGRATTANGSGGSGGKAVALNGFSVTWVSGNTTRVYGAVA